MPDTPAWMKGKPVSDGAQPAWMQGKAVGQEEAPAAQALSDGLADWQRNLKQVTTHTGKPSVQRYDDGVWYGPEQGNTGEAGWFDGEGNRLPLNPEGILPKAVLAPVRTFARPFERTIEGIAQLAARAGGDKATSDFVQKSINENEADFQQNGYKGPGSGALEFAGAVMQPLPGAGSLGVGKAAIAKGLARTAGIGALSGATQPVYGNGENFARDKAFQTALGGLLAPAGQLGIEKGAVPLLNRGLTAISGKMNPQAQTIQDLADRLRIRTTAGDLSQQPGAKKAEVLLESIPGVGMGTFRGAQNKEAGAAAAGLAEQLQQAMKTEGWSNLAQVKAAAARGRKGAQELLSQLQNAGDDWEQVVQASGNLKGFLAKLKADELYNKVETLSAQHGEVPLLNTARALEEVKRELNRGLPSASTKKVIADLEARMGTTSANAEAAVGASAVGGGTVVSAAEPALDNSFSGLRVLRSDLGDLVKDATKGGGEITGTKAANALKRLRTAVEQDMETFAKSNGPELSKAWRDADAYYRTAVVPFKDKALAKALSEGHPDELFGQFIKVGKGDRAQRFYENLDPKGQAAIRVGLVQNALEKATSAKPGVDGATIFSPAQFAGYLEKMGDATGMAFKGHEKWEINGLTKLMRHIERAGQYAENPPTGNRVLPYAVGAGAWAAPTSATGAWVTAKGLQKMLTTPAGKRFLLAASDLQPGSKAMQALMENRLPALAAGTTEATTRNEPTQP